MAADLQARLYRMGLVTNSYLDPHLQLISAATIGPRGVDMQHHPRLDWGEAANGTTGTPP